MPEQTYLFNKFLNKFSPWYYILHWSLIIFLGLIIYGQTFTFGFVFDDHQFIVNNFLIKSFEHLKYLLVMLPFTRLVGICSFAFNYSLHGLNPVGYHIFNFLVHLLATGIVWALATKIFRLVNWYPHRFKENREAEPDLISQEIPFIIALLFLVHPGQTQAVTYISQRFESMATLFYLSTVYLYLCGRLSSVSLHRTILFILAGLCALLGILTKEVVGTIPLLLLAVEFILQPSLHKNTIPPSGIFKVGKIWLYLFLAAGGVLFSLLFMKLVNAGFDIFFQRGFYSESHDGDIITGYNYFLTQLRVFLTFIRLFILPIGQSVDYDYPVSLGLFNPPLTFVGGVLLVFIISLIFKLRRQWPVVAFGLAWILITFSINLAPRTNVIFEHKLYLLSFGFFLSLVPILCFIIRQRMILIGALFFLVTTFSIMSLSRNAVWENSFTLWENVISKFPSKQRAYNHLAISQGTQQQYEQLINQLNEIIKKRPKKL